jgi:hypothetical protein
MNNQTEDIEDIFKGIDAALRRAAQTAKKNFLRKMAHPS